MVRYPLAFVLLILLGSCGDETPHPIEEMYFPPLLGDNWETTNHGWNTQDLEDLFQFLEDNNTRAFLVLINGRIVAEKYWGNTITGGAPFDKESVWYWASAGKTLTAFLTGIAQKRGELNIDDSTSDYLSAGWTSMDSEKEEQITIRHQLTMTTGIEYDVMNDNCTLPECLQYKSDPGTQWFYHNAPYTLVGNVIEAASGSTMQAYTKSQVLDKIGMKGGWIMNNYNRVFWSTPRDMARFGLLMLNEGKWEDGEELLEAEYLQEMINSSQSLNPAYGYLTWLNGKSSLIYPGLAASFNFKFTPNAPDDLYAAAGKNGQFMDVIPSENMVVIRMGDNPDNSLVPVQFHNDMWEKISTLIED